MVSVTHVTWVFTTPDELREIAAKMDSIIAEGLPGTSLTAHVFWGPPGNEVRISADQDRVRHLLGCRVAR